MATYAASQPNRQPGTPTSSAQEAAADRSHWQLHGVSWIMCTHAEPRTGVRCQRYAIIGVLFLSVPQKPPRKSNTSKNIAGQSILPWGHLSLAMYWLACRCYNPRQQNQAQFLLVLILLWFKSVLCRFKSSKRKELLELFWLKAKHRYAFARSQNIAMFLLESNTKTQGGVWG